LDDWEKHETGDGVVTEKEKDKGKSLDEMKIINESLKDGFRTNTKIRCILHNSIVELNKNWSLKIETIIEGLKNGQNYFTLKSYLYQHSALTFTKPPPQQRRERGKGSQK